MAGGEGRRLGISGEKPLLEFGGRPMVDRVLDALLGSKNISRVLVALTKNTPRTEAQLRQKDGFQRGEISVVKTPGSGYVEDLLFAMRSLNLRRAFVTSSDLPLLTPGDVEYVIEEYRARGGRGSMAVVVPLSLVAELGFTPNYPVGEYAATGVNILDLDDGRESILATRKINFAANINAQSDVVAARKLHKV